MDDKRKNWLVILGQKSVKVTADSWLVHSTGRLSFTTDETMIAMFNDWDCVIEDADNN